MTFVRPQWIQPKETDMTDTPTDTDVDPRDADDDPVVRWPGYPMTPDETEVREDASAAGTAHAASSP